MDQSSMNPEVVGHGKTCGCMHHKMIPLLIVLIGVVFLLGNLGKISMETVSIIWPALVILAGLQKMFSGMCKCCK
jgi:hypothetical protein